MAERPDPSALLARARRDDAAHEGRGKLRIYVGAFAGVGKTYAMLNEAQRRRRYGEDVVAGFVETHGRAQTAAMLAGLEVVPRARIDYRGVTAEEMDVEAILRRRPAVCLVDELAHTNVPGSEREKRYEDIEVLLAAGIDVVSTLNVQHLESLNDTVHALTAVRVRETVPDFVVDGADDLILIDLSPEAARARMEHGHIYPPEQARAALDRFFRIENLTALRELALRRTAQEVDERLHEYMRELARPAADVDEHVLVLVDEAPAARALIRRGWRLAQAMQTDLLVAYVRRDLGDAARASLARILELAEDLNARVIPLDADTAEGLGDLVERERIHHLVLAHAPRGALARALRPSLAEALLERAPQLQVHLAREADA